jgi:hypothetical protein
MAPISETEKDGLGLFSTGAHALASQTPIYSAVLTFPFEAHKLEARWVLSLPKNTRRKKAAHRAKTQNTRE